MTDDEIRALVLAKRVTLMQLVLTPSQIEIVEMCKIKPMSSTELTQLKSMSVFMANNHLLTLVVKGYLDSTTKENAFGGKHQEYFVPSNLWKLIDGQQ